MSRKARKKADALMADLAEMERRLVAEFPEVSSLESHLRMMLAIQVDRQMPGALSLTVGEKLERLMVRWPGVVTGLSSATLEWLVELQRHGSSVLTGADSTGTRRLTTTSISPSRSPAGVQEPGLGRFHPGGR
jgi:hypothetical protein